MHGFKKYVWLTLLFYSLGAWHLAESMAASNSWVRGEHAAAPTPIRQGTQILWVA